MVRGPMSGDTGLMVEHLRPDEIGIDFWPDMSEYSDTYNTEMNYVNGANAKLFSSHDLSTTRKHFEWMRDYNIHGVHLQRFLGELKDNRFFRARNNILQNCNYFGSRI